MKILAVSDKVLDSLYSSQVYSRHPDIDLLIGCGDVPFYYLEFLSSALDTRTVYVKGNHDRSPQYTVDGRKLTKVLGGEDLHCKSTVIDNVIIAGLEGSMRYRPGAPLMYNDSEMRNNIGKLLPTLLMNRIRYGRFLDILITHSPPYGIHDQDDLPHTGFRDFLPFMRWVKPRYLLHGHIHLYRPDTIRQTRYCDTEVINVYPYHIFEI